MYLLKAEICMLKIIKNYLFIFLLIFSPYVLAQSLSTATGNIRIPTEAEINAQISLVTEDSNLTEDARKNKITSLNQSLEQLNKLNGLTNEYKALKNKLATAPQDLKHQSLEYSNTEKNYSKIPDISKLNAEEIENTLPELKDKTKVLQDSLTQISAELSSLQTLPERVQSTLTNNKASIKTSMETINSASDINSFDVRLKALNILVLNKENELFQEKFQSLSTLQNLADYQHKILNTKLKYYQNYVTALQNRQTELLVIAKDDSNNADSQNVTTEDPELLKLLNTNKNILNYLNEARQRNSILNKNAHEVNSTLSQIQQIQKSLNAQLQDLNRSLVLSRLLNKQQSVIPEIKLSYNLDETIPDLNIWLYDLKELRDDLFDISKATDDIIKLTPALETKRSKVEAILKQRQDLYNTLYQELANELNTSIALKIDYTELNKLSAQVKNNITEKLFWIRSNQPISLEFLFTVVPHLTNEISSIVQKLYSDEFLDNTLHTILTVSPLWFLAFLIIYFRKYLSRVENRLAMRLDHQNDRLWVTPLAIIVSILNQLPKMIWRIVIGAIFVVLLLADSNSQEKVILMLSLHIAVFVFCLEILNPNSLAQRHFSIPPAELEQKRVIMGKIWIAAIPILIIANIAEIDAANIYYDILGYLIVVISSLALVVLSANWLKNKLTSERISPAMWLFSGLCICVPMVILIMMLSGYYYTTVKLINRLAYTFYFVLLYWLLKNTIRRMMHTAENSLLQKRLQKFNKLKHKEEKHLNKPGIRFEFIGAKAFKLVNIVLLAFIILCIYILWNDLAGVLGYLKTVNILSNEQIVGGQKVITSALTVADILLALFILAVAGILNRNLPALLEKIMLLRSDNTRKSTAYTVKIVSSYGITALGIIFAAGALGIKWENLQWLVAALSVGLGFGLQEIFANFVSGLIILFERQIRVGDIITLSGLSGTVNKIRIRSTTIISFENKEVMIPNRQFITSALTNWSLSNTVTKLEFTVGVAYGTDVEKAKALLKQIVSRCAYISKANQPVVFIQSLAESSVNILCEVFVSEIGKRKATNDYLCSETLRVFAENNIEIPFNMLEVNIKNLDKSKLAQEFKQSMLKAIE